MRKFVASLPLRRAGWYVLFAAMNCSAGAAEVDESKLPPAASVKIDFARDIKPIFEQSCLRCHGPEKPKSKFRLDNRDFALKGGDKGVDIVVGKSGGSPLIHYVAGLVEDMQMPPPGKGDALTTNQVSLLRAWIDQGAVWEPTEAGALAFSFSPSFRYITVDGDEHKFREHYWQHEGVNGGLENFEIKEQIKPDTTATAGGHVLRDDYKLRLSLEKNDIGFIHSGWEQYRKYYDDTGGYFPSFNPPSVSLRRDLHLDIGKAWVDFGLTLPNWPRMVLGYEYDYQTGEKSLTEWGDVVGPGGNSRKINPATKKIDEHAHIIKFELEHEIKGVRIEESFRGEFYDLNTQRTNIVYAPSLGNLTSDDAREGYHHFEGANTIRLERKFNDWLLASGGYLYSKLNANASFSLDTADISGFPLGSQRWRTPGITLERESHVFNLNGLAGPFDGLTFSSGMQSEWTREKGLGQLTMDTTFPGGFSFSNPASFSSDYDKASVEENLAMRYTKIPYTSLFAEVRLEQQSIGELEQLQDAFHDQEEFRARTAFTSRLTDFRTGFNTSPWQSVTFGAHYRRYDNENQYPHNVIDQQPIGFPGISYPAFFRSRDLLTDEVEAKLVLHPVTWFKTTLSYKLQTTDYRTETDAVPNPVPGGGLITPGGSLVAGKYDAHIYSINGTLTPFRRLYFSTTFSYSDSSTVTQDNGVSSVAPYRGDVYSALVSATYVLSQSCDLTGSYSFSYADYSQGNFVAGLPVGIRYQQHAVQAGLSRKFGKNLTTRLQYGYFYYDEPTSGNVNNYRANAIFATLTYRFQ
jgi:mono/diheme cytochrome c family protein